MVEERKFLKKLIVVYIQNGLTLEYIAWTLNLFSSNSFFNMGFDDARIVSQIRSSRRESSWCILIMKKDKKGLCCTGVAPATKPPMPKLERVAQI